jgi:hypothetical protein
MEKKWPIIPVISVLVGGIIAVDSVASDSPEGKTFGADGFRSAVILSINGTNFDDLNKNAIFDGNEPGLPGWIVRLKLEGRDVSSTTTNESGFYSFTNLMPGNYTVTEDQQMDWARSVPGGGHYDTYLIDKNAYGYNFGNFRISITTESEASDEYDVNATGEPPSADATDISYVTTVMQMTPEDLERENKIYQTLPNAYIKPGGAPPIKNFDLLNYLPTTDPKERNQGYCGNCWVWACTACLEISHAVEKNIRDRLSIQYLNSNFRPQECYACCGGSMDDFEAFYNGFSSRSDNYLSVIPWSNTNANYADSNQCCGKKRCRARGSDGCYVPNDRPKVPARDISLKKKYSFYPITLEKVPTRGISKDQAINNIKNVLNQQRAVVFTYRFDGNNLVALSNFWKTAGEEAIWKEPEPSDAEFGSGIYGHALTCVGYNDADPQNSYWILLNSWGAPSNRPNGLLRVSMDLDYDTNWYGWNTFKVIWR